MFKKSLIFKAFSIVMLLSLLLTACQSAGTATKTLGPVRYGGQYYPEDFLVKGNPDFWKDYNVSVEQTLFSSGTESSQALVSGSVDIISASDSKSVALFATIPDDALIIAVAQRGDRYSTLVRTDSTYLSWYDLKGKKVGIRLKTGAEQVVRRYFEKVGDLKWEDFEWVNIKVEESTAALKDGAIEAFTAWEPTPAIAEAQGVGRVLMSYGEIAMTPVVLMTTKKYAEGHKAELVAFLAGLLKKTELIQSDPANAAGIAARAASAAGSEVSPDAFEKIFRRVNFSMELDESVITALNDTAAFLQSIGEVKAAPKFAYDTSYLEEAKKLVSGK